MKIYYHVIEEGHYGNIGSHGYYKTLEEAKKRVGELQEMFPRLFFYVFQSPLRNEAKVLEAISEVLQQLP